MRAISDYSDDDLLRLHVKTVGTGGGKERAELIQAELDARGVKDARTSFLEGLSATNVPPA